MVKKRNLPQLLSVSALLVCTLPREMLERLVVTWFVASSNHRHSAFLIPHFTSRIPQFRILPISYIKHQVNSYNTAII